MQSTSARFFTIHSLTAIVSELVISPIPFHLHFQPGREATTKKYLDENTTYPSINPSTRFKFPPALILCYNKNRSRKTLDHCLDSGYSVSKTPSKPSNSPCHLRPTNLPLQSCLKTQSYGPPSIQSSSCVLHRFLFSAISSSLPMLRP
jgi:hypothetical protein